MRAVNSSEGEGEKPLSVPSIFELLFIAKCLKKGANWLGASAVFLK